MKRQGKHRVRLVLTETTPGKKRDWIRSTSVTGLRKQPGIKSKIFLGPTVDGKDEVYIKVLSGKVARQKPSFAVFK
ncbi:hypothetical protein [Brevibacillus centrosporus]|uniref:Uncharacterized protein n=1 Tax=Brevibacillus centrosporus TaxID=54910 RepID=A0A1I4C288_9BACL|nr:hypothetical protein [Brevibacillus centrosporus]MEC2128872.1 hypothetical protein [Brevibacillus centrosporus]MED4907637.1 hypothetical protein [Brevibacillus centrosporus]RNB67084.1 hypothetical protein EDM55_21330 [Brevibacillus centrosporus]SFK75184.1 hypothetical protein SAMN05518846_11932 [Brevibacillus centrosporus]GED33748.1 hypothetical protein BCE02nite_48890 [Brevibacillus centrosporus]